MKWIPGQKTNTPTVHTRTPPDSSQAGPYSQAEHFSTWTQAAVSKTPHTQIYDTRLMITQGRGSCSPEYRTAPLQNTASIMITEYKKNNHIFEGNP